VYLVRACRSYPIRATGRKPIGVTAGHLLAADRGQCYASTANANVNAHPIANPRPIADVCPIANSGAIADAAAIAARNRLRYGDEQYRA
jgi:hypothetical protein